MSAPEQDPPSPSGETPGEGTDELWQLEAKIPGLREGGQHALAAALGALLLAATGCADHGFCRAGSVTETPTGLWMAGAHGVAAFSSGRTFERRDYPTPGWRYRDQDIILEQARVLMVRDEAWLFALSGDVFRWGGAGWIPVDVRWPRTPSPLRVSFVGLGPDGSLAARLHPLTLAWSPPEALGARWTVEPLPFKFQWLGFIDGVLHAFSRESQLYSIRRRVAPGRWEIVGEPSDELEVLGVFRIPGGPLTAATLNGLWLFREGRAPQLVPARALAARKHPTHARPTLVAAAVAQAPPAAAQGTSEAPPPRPAPGPEPSTEWPAYEPFVPNEISVYHAFQASGHGPLLLLSNKTLVEIGAREVTAMECDWMFQRPPAGAATTPAGLRLVDENGSVVEVGPGVPCKLAARGTINWDDR